MPPESWLADRTRAIEVSGIRKVFELGTSLKDPINLSIGQPHFDVPEPIKAAAKARHRRGAQRLHRHPGHLPNCASGSSPMLERPLPGPGSRRRW